MFFNHFFFRFQLYYYSDAEFKKEERKDTVLTIDTRTKIDKVKQLHFKKRSNLLTLKLSTYLFLDKSKFTTYAVFWDCEKTSV